MERPGAAHKASGGDGFLCVSSLCAGHKVKCFRMYTVSFDPKKNAMTWILWLPFYR